MSMPPEKIDLTDNDLIGSDLFYEADLVDDERFIIKDNVRQNRIAELVFKYKNNNDLMARNEIVQSNMGLVGKVVRRYIPSAEMMGLTAKDLENYGAIGLMKAVERYDPEKAAFSTYALQWIWSEVQRQLQNQGAPMRLPSQLARILPSIYRALQALEQEKGQTIYLHQAEPFIDEIAERVNASIADIMKCIHYAPRRRNLQVGAEHDSNGDFFTDDEVLSQIDLEYSDINDKDSRMDQTLSILEDEETSALVDLWLAQLPSAEMRTVICHSYGLRGLEVLPFQRLTQVMRMSPSQIKTLREEALDIMRSLARDQSGG